MKKQLGFWAGVGIALTFTALLLGWQTLFGKVNGQLLQLVIHHKTWSILSNGQARVSLMLSTVFYGWKWMALSLQKGTLRHRASLIWKTVSETRMLPPA